MIKFDNTTGQSELRSISSNVQSNPLNTIQQKANEPFNVAVHNKNRDKVKQTHLESYTIQDVNEQAFKVSLFKSKDIMPESRIWTWDDIKKELEILDFKDNEADGWAFTPCVFEPRVDSQASIKKENISEISVIALEIKNKRRFSDLLKELGKLDFAFAVYSGYSEYQYRAVIPLFKPIPAKHFNKLLDWLKTEINLNISTKEAIELHYLPITQKEREGFYEFKINEGNFFDWSKVIPESNSKVELEVLFPLSSSLNSYQTEFSEEKPAKEKTDGLSLLKRCSLNSLNFSKEKQNGYVPVENINTKVSHIRKCFYGLAGEIVKTIEPHTESDSLALLLNTLVAFGNAIGRKAFFEADGAKHYTNLYGILVGSTSAGKGTSWSQIKKLFALIDKDWSRNRIQSGLSSGEGLISVVKDDDTPKDKRLLVVESEFASVLSMNKREGNTLSPIIRGFWDEGSAQTMTKNEPMVVNDAHISIIGHITPNELRARLNQTEIANGFVNRFLWLEIKRSKSLPEGGKLSDEELNALAGKLSEAVEFSQTVEGMERDEEARLLWIENYPKLTAERSGAFGNATARARAQVVRLSLIYALMDKSNIVRREHLEAAFDLWSHCENSARQIFGVATGDKLADKLYQHLKTSKNGLTKTEMHKITHNNNKADEMDYALAFLASEGLAYSHHEKREGSSHYIEVWYCYEFNELENSSTKNSSPKDLGISI